MPNVLDVLGGNRFSSVAMTEAVNALPYKPGKIGSMNLFNTKAVSTTSVEIESRGGVLQLLTSATRGTAGTARNKSKRRVRTFAIPHFPHQSAILAESIQGVNVFGKPDQLQTVTQVVNDELQEHRDNHEITHEYLMLGALRGDVIDGDGSTTLYNLFTEFGVSRDSVDFLLGTSTSDVKGDAASVRRLIENALGNHPFSGISAACGDEYWDKLVAHANVKAAFDRWEDGKFLREDQRTVGGFVFAGVHWFNYRGQIGSVPYVADADCEFFPTGVNGLFTRYNGPADYIEAVNTLGLPIYTKQSRMKFDKGVELESQSNPLMMCNRPKVLVRGTTSN